MTNERELLKKQIKSKERILQCMYANNFSKKSIKRKEEELEILEEKLKQLK